MAQGLAEDYSVVGLDNSPHMLKKAQQKASNIQLIHGDITSFTLDGKFDVVTCLHNSVNHLQTFEDWMNLFRMVSQHLQPRGIFIFDINPPERMESMVAYGPSTRQIDDRYLIIQVFHDKTPGSYIWDVKILLKKRKKYIVHHEPIRVSAYAEAEVMDALRSEFDKVSRFVPTNPATPDDRGRVYYICSS